MRLRTGLRTIVFGIGYGVAACGLVRQVAGQAPMRPVVSGPVRGVVFDSVRGRPLRDAFVSINGGTQSTTTDERGRFRFDSVSGGVRTFTVQHASLDSLGFSGLTKRATIGSAN